MGAPAYLATIKISGTATTFADEATNQLAGTNNYQIADDVKQIFDRTTAIIVKADDVIVASSEYRVDSLFGIIEFASEQTETITVSGKYIPVADAVGATQYSVDLGGDILDNTSFQIARANNGFRTRLYGINDFSVSLTRYDDLVGNFTERLQAREYSVIEIKPSGGDIIRLWALTENTGKSGDIAGLESETISFQGADDGATNISWRSIA